MEFLILLLFSYLCSVIKINSSTYVHIVFLTIFNISILICYQHSMKHGRCDCRNRCFSIKSLIQFSTLMKSQKPPRWLKVPTFISFSHLWTLHTTPQAFLRQMQLLFLPSLHNYSLFQVFFIIVTQFRMYFKCKKSN